MRLEREKGMALDPGGPTFDLVTVDVFDTLLLRDRRCEKRRFFLIAEQASLALAKVGVEASVAALYRSRVDAQRFGYRAMEAVRPQGEVRLATLHEIQSAALGLPASAAKVLEQAEFAFEASGLRANLPLLRWLWRAREAGKRVVAVSDIYLPADFIRELLDRVAPRHPVEAVYCSSEFNLTKRSAELFAAVLRQEGKAEPDRVLHLGDDPHADVEMALRAGLQARWLPRRAARLARKLDGAMLMAGAGRSMFV